MYVHMCMYILSPSVQVEGEENATRLGSFLTNQRDQDIEHK